MYLAHYNLKEKPFQINPDPKFLWLGETHKEALAILKYGILDRRGFLLLIGDVGTGKTTLINELLNSLGKNTIVATVSNPGLEKLDFYNFLANAFKMGKKFGSKGDFLVHFIHFLHKAHAERKKVLLIIDEAQRLDDETLEEIRLLSNIEKQDAKLLNIFLVGQNELNEILARTRNRALMQRIANRYSIGPLKKNEVEDYIRFRLSVAGTQRNLFSSGAIRQIISFSKCYPRMINIICDHALLTGFVKGVKGISSKIVKECAAELRPAKRRLKEKGVKSAWMIPASIALGALLMIAAGYFLLSGRYIKSPLNMRRVKTGNSSSATQMNKQPGSNKKIQAFSKSEKASSKSSPPADISLSESGAAVSTKETGKLNKKGTINNVPDLAASSQKGALVEKKKKDISDRIQKPVPFPDQKLIINFPLNSNEFSDEAYEQLDRFVEIIFRNPDVEIIIKGYTDSSGSYSYNKRLSRFRANIVKSYFVGQGISPQKIKTFGMGPEDPLESNATIQGKRANRRIEIELKKNKQE